MLNIQLPPGEELCDCKSCQRLAHEPLSLRIPRSRYHKLMDARANRKSDTTNDDEAEAG
jgi:hypothetical protein